MDGRTAAAITSVQQLVDVFPARCLVRKSINALTTDDVCRGDATRSRSLNRGEVLTLVRITGQRLLHCHDERGHGVYLPLNQRGLFSVVSGHTAASVYTLRSLLAEFRLPIVVRLVYGSLPTRYATTGDLRLVGIQTDRITFVLPLSYAWTSKKPVDRRALAAVPSKHASRLTVAAAARDFYHQWLMSDDGLQLRRRCNEIVASWKVSVHDVPSTEVAAAATSAAVSLTGESYSCEGDDATWTRGPMASSVDSGLASSAGSPSLLCAGPAVDNEHLEQEIDDIYAKIRHSSDGTARQGRARSLDDCVSGGHVRAQKRILVVYGARRQAADALHGPRVLRHAAKRKHVVQHDMTRSSSPGAARRLSGELATTSSVKLVGMRVRPEVHDRDSQCVASIYERVSEPTLKRQPPHYRNVDSSPVYDELHVSTTPNRSNARRTRSKSLPEVTVVTPEPPSERRRHHKSVVGTITRSIANVFRRMRHKSSRTFTVDTDFTTFTSERYSRKTYDSTR